MADEFNPQGVDQTPRNNENPNSTADTGNAEPKNPFVGGDSVDAGNASDSSEQQAPVSSAALAADQQPTQAATEPIPDYASAKGESTVVSSSPASPAAPAADQTSATTPLYRPAPEYGAYGPTPTQAQGQQGGQAGSNAQPTQQFPFGQPAQQTPQGQQDNRNPYYTNNPQPQGNGNPFNPPTQPQQNNGNPFASQSGQNGRNGQQPQQEGEIDILMPPVDAREEGPVEGPLADKGEAQHPQGIFFEIVGVEEALHQQETVDGKGQPPRQPQNTVQLNIPRPERSLLEQAVLEQGRADVVQQHR